MNSIVALGVCIHRCGVFNRHFASRALIKAVTTAGICYLNLCWHFYGLQRLHEQRVRRLEGPIGHWHRQKYGEQLGGLPQSRRSQEFCSLFLGQE